MNTRLLRKVAKHILAEPRRLDMDSVYKPIRLVPKKLRPPCGTVCCIAGWAIVLGSKVDGFEDVFPVVAGSTRDIKFARELLKIDGNELFFESSWPEPFQAKYLAAKTPRTRAKIAVARIEHFIKTKGKE